MKKTEYESDTQRRKYKLNVCLKCRYFSTSVKEQIGLATCDYMLMEGHRRPCHPMMCREEGIWKHRDRKRKTKGQTIIIPRQKYGEPFRRF